ncbi:hypothetical protein Niako_6705 [Niastella koreensis GR20-10]|uniref:Uncharacterized protein n=1 Tax=Niastella koreensis (strain DSM 17620 / KACC 11465 / NBRC 106392 / GR20-10) TaxID=700598 RepID=G8TJZ1_NIAKG|nr:hypothetical protein Niako_6705 [Niastella koreensis GR20-10]
MIVSIHFSCIKQIRKSKTSGNDTGNFRLVCSENEIVSANKKLYW